MQVLSYKIDWNVIRKIAVVWVDPTIEAGGGRIYSSYQRTYFRTSSRQCSHHRYRVHTQLPLPTLILSFLQKNTKLFLVGNIYQYSLGGQLRLVSAADGRGPRPVRKNSSNTCPQYEDWSNQYVSLIAAMLSKSWKHLLLGKLRVGFVLFWILLCRAQEQKERG